MAQQQPQPEALSLCGASPGVGEGHGGEHRRSAGGHRPG